MGGKPWLLLFHQIPPKPPYFRVKIWRRLQSIGAVALKNSVYVLPTSDSSLEHFHWVTKEIVEGGGDATVCSAQLVEGLDDSAVEALFRAARDADYAQLGEEARSLAATLLGSKGQSLGGAGTVASVSKLRRRFAEIAELDFFGAPGRKSAEGLVLELERQLTRPAPSRPLSGKAPSHAPRGHTWVTRSGIHVDRIASAWLVRRFIDPQARFRFVDPKTYVHGRGELRFDMFEAEYTHEGEACTFEVLLQRFGLTDPALRQIGQMVHDVDLKERKFDLAETPGFERLIAGIAMGHRSDEERLARGSAVLDDFHTVFARKGASQPMPATKTGPTASRRSRQGRKR